MDQKPRILLVEDERSLREGIKMNLELEDFEVVDVEDGSAAILRFQGERFNLVILDVMLPKVSGFEVCEKIRLEDANVPVLFLTAKHTPEDKIKGLKLGADDYLTKPFNLEELMLRVKVLIKHSYRGTAQEEALQNFSFGNNVVNFNTYKATGSGGEFTLTKKEALLLRLLIDRQGEVVSRQQILQNVWGYDVYPSTRTIDNFILAFRKYFEVDPRNPKFFHSVRGVGYRFGE